MARMPISSIIGTSIGYGLISGILAYSSGILMLLASDKKFVIRRDSLIDIKDNLRPSGI